MHRLSGAERASVELLFPVRTENKETAYIESKTAPESKRQLLLLIVVPPDKPGEVFKIQPKVKLACQVVEQSEVNRQAVPVGNIGKRSAVLSSGFGHSSVYIGDIHARINGFISPVAGRKSVLVNFYLGFFPVGAAGSSDNGVGQRPPGESPVIAYQSEKNKVLVSQHFRRKNFLRGQSALPGDFKSHAEILFFNACKAGGVEKYG